MIEELRRNWVATYWELSTLVEDIQRLKLQMTNTRIKWEHNQVANWLSKINFLFSNGNKWNNIPDQLCNLTLKKNMKPFISNYITIIILFFLPFLAFVFYVGQ